MRLKPFIIFIIIFTICYYGGWYLFDCYKNKKDMEKTAKDNYEMININNLIKFASFYEVNITIDNTRLVALYEEMKQLISAKLSELATKYNVSVEELIIAILFLEYKGLVRTRTINVNLDTITKLTDKEESLIIKYSLLFSNKYDYKTLVTNAGFGSEKEIDYMMEKYLVPGVKLDNQTIYYIGDENE